MTTTDADRLAYDERPMVELHNPDQKLELHFGYGGLRRIEKHFGSIQGLTSQLEKGVDGELFDAVFMGILFGLWKQGMTEEKLDARLDPQELEQHATVLGEALVAAFPKQVQATSEEAQESQNVSTGPAPTSSFESPAVSQMMSSGQ